MPGISFHDPIFAMQAGAATDWGSVDGKALVKIPADLQLNRGARLELGIQALATVDARFSKFITAQLAGQVQAQAHVQGQIQMPMNLFREVGFAVRLQAILEASAGIQVGLGLSVGDFVALAHSQLQLRGLPLTLFRIFLEEVDVGMSLFAKVAYTAQAYANLVATGTLVANDQTQPGFTILFGYGCGVKGGYGMRVSARAGIRDVRRLVQRSVDTTVDHTIDELIGQMPTEDKLTPRILDASRAPAKIAFRIGYELGEYIVKNSVGQTDEGAQRIAMRCVQVALEESQRYLLRKMVDIAMAAIESHLRGELGVGNAAQWTALRSSREALASRLQSMPAEPFDLEDGVALTFWNDVAVLSTNLLIDLAGPSGISPEARRNLAILWSAVQLMFAATRRIVDANVSVSVIGLPPLQAKASFEGPLASQPHAVIAEAIRDGVESATGSAGTGDLTQQDLLVFLMDTVVLDALFENAPEIEEYLEMFTRPTGGMGVAKADIARLMMTSLGSVIKDADGNFDDQAALKEFAFGLRLFIADKFEAIVVPAIRAAVPAQQSELLMYVDEVLLPSMHMVIDTCFDQAIGWASGTVSQKALEEALSSVIMSILGRTLVLTGDLMMTIAQEQASEVLEALAREPGVPEPANALIRVPSGFAESAATIIAPALPLSEPEIAEGLREFLLIGADVARPFPPQTRAKIRRLMYEALDPLPAENPASLAESLKNDLWIPNDEALVALGGELMAQVGERLVEFALRLLERLAEIALEIVAEAIAAAVEAVTRFIGELAEAIQVLVQRLAELALAINAAVAQIEARVGDFLDRAESLLNAMASRRSSLATTVTSRLVEDATTLLEANWLFIGLPSEIKTVARNTMRTTIASAIGAPILDPVSDAIAGIAADLEGCIEDIRALDPNEGLVTGIHGLLLERIEYATLSALGGANPGIDVKFKVEWECQEIVYIPPMGFETRTKTCSVSFDLGRIELPVSGLFAAIGSAIMGAAIVEQRIAALASTLHEMLVAELEAIALRDEQDETAAERVKLDAAAALVDERADDVSIVEPAMGSVHQFSVLVTIVIEGVSEEFARVVDGAPPRVVAWLDGEELDLAGAQIEPWSGADAGGVPGVRAGFAGAGASGLQPIAGARTVDALRRVNKDRVATTTAGALSRQVMQRQKAAQLRTAHALERTARSERRRQEIELSTRDAVSIRLGEPAGTGPREVGIANDRGGGVEWGGVEGGGVEGRGIERTTLGHRSIWSGDRTVLTAPTLYRPIVGDRAGVLIVTSIPLATIEEGFHTLVVAVADGSGRELRDTATFVVEAAPLRGVPGSRPDLAKPDLMKPDLMKPVREPLRAEDVAPRPTTRERPVFPPKRERVETAKRAREAVLRRDTDPIRRVAALSERTSRIVAERFPSRSRSAAPTKTIENKPVATGRPTAPSPPASPPPSPPASPPASLPANLPATAGESGQHGRRTPNPPPAPPAQRPSKGDPA